MSNHKVTLLTVNFSQPRLVYDTGIGTAVMLWKEGEWMLKLPPESDHDCMHHMGVCLHCLPEVLRRTKVDTEKMKDFFKYE